MLQEPKCSTAISIFLLFFCLTEAVVVDWLHVSSVLCVEVPWFFCLTEDLMNCVANAYCPTCQWWFLDDFLGLPFLGCVVDLFYFIWLFIIVCVTIHCLNHPPYLGSVYFLIHSYLFVINRIFFEFPVTFLKINVEPFGLALFLHAGSALELLYSFYISLIPRPNKN